MDREVNVVSLSYTSDVIPVRTMCERVMRLENSLAHYPQMILDVKHDFSKGIYSRTLLIPAGTMLTGKIHKTEHLCIVQGDITALTDAGIRRLTGYNVLNSKPGMKRAGFAHEDTYWTTIHVTTETNIEKLEAELIAPSFEALDEFLEEAQCLLSQ